MDVVTSKFHIVTLEIPRFRCHPHRKAGIFLFESRRKTPAFRHGDISRVLFKEVVQWNILTSFDCTPPKSRSGRYIGLLAVAGMSGTTILLAVMRLTNWTGIP